MYIYIFIYVYHLSFPTGYNLRTFPEHFRTFVEGNDEREQTVNQLLTEMDGFEGNKAFKRRTSRWVGWKASKNDG